MDQQFDLRTALITGGTRGVGRAVARELASRGVRHLYINYLEREDALASLREELSGWPVTVTGLPFNLADPSRIRELVTEVAGLTDRIDYVVHCAAVTTFKPLLEVRPNQWDLTMAVSVRAFQQLVRELGPLLVEGSSVVAVSSTGSARYNPDYGALGVAKSALESTVRYLAVELAPKGVRVNGVMPGLLGGNSLPPFPQVEEMIRQTLERTPAGRLGRVEDVAEAAAFLLVSGSWIVGQILVVDGGYCLT